MESGVPMTSSRKMVNDIVNFVVSIFTVRFNTIIFLLVLSIYIFTLWIVGSVQTIGLLLSLALLAGSIALGYFEWFGNKLE